MKVISILNLKGGVAKTTTALNIGLALRDLKYKVLFIDLDYQKSLTTLLDEENTITAYDVLNNEKPLTILNKALKNDILVSHEDLLTLDDLEPNKLKKILESIKNLYDYVIIDNHCIVNSLTLNSLLASDLLVIPTPTTKLGYKGVEDMISLLDLLKKVYKTNIKSYMLLIDYKPKVELNIQYKKALEELIEDKPIKMMSSIIRHSQAIENSQAMLESIYSYSKISNGAKDYLKATKEIIKGDN